MRLFDLHCDTLGFAVSHGVAITDNACAVDLRRGGQYERWTQAFAAWLPDKLPVVSARSRCEAMLDAAWRWHADTAGFCPVKDWDGLTDPTPVCRALLTVENGGALAADIGYLEHLHRRGVRMITLTWNGDNAWGSGCFGHGDGLTAAGVQAVHAMETCGIAVDVSHLNAAGFRQVAAIARRPFVASHSNAAAVFPHRRNLTDDQFRVIRDCGGLVGLNLYGEHLDGWDFTAFRRHLEHFLSLGGEHTVCLGTDLDGMEAPDTWDGLSVVAALRQYLEDAGYPADLLEAVFYTNALHYFGRLWGNT